MPLFGHKSLVAVALVAHVSALSAQAPAKPTCDAADASKGNAAKATLFINVARDDQASSAMKAQNLTSVVKLVEKTDKGDDPVVNAYVLGSALSLWASQPGIGLMPKRGRLGFTTNTDATIDIPVTLDSLFSIVEAAMPGCNDYTSFWRAGQKFYIETVNSAINALNAEKLDSAEIYANQANRLFGKSPYGVMILGNVASRRNDNANALAYWQRAADISAKDTMYRDVRRQMLSNIGTIYVANVSSATGADRAAAAKKVSDLYTELMAMPGARASFIAAARQSIQNAYLLAGDTASAQKSWEPLIANCSQYDYLDLINSAVSASRANRMADAGKLFGCALVQNPYSRDALYNVALTELSQEHNDKLGPIVTRLVDVDPGNPENFNLAARAYLALAKAAQTAKNNALVKAYNDSTTSWYNRGNKLPIELTFREFSPSEKQAVIGGAILDRRDKSDLNADAASAPPPAAKGAKGKAAASAKPPAKTYPARTYTVTFSALDKAGAVLGPQTFTTEPLTPGQTSKFSVTIPSANAAAYKYSISE